MRILFISRCPPLPLHFGDRLMLYYLVRELTAMGHEIELLALDLDDARVASIGATGPNGRYEIVRERTRYPLGYLMRLFRPFPGSANRCWNPELWERASQKIKARQFNVVHFFGGIQVYELRNLVKGLLPTVIVPFDSMSLLYHRRLEILSGFRRRLTARLEAKIASAYERRIYAGFGRVVLVSPVDQDWLLSLNPSLPTTVIPNGVDSPLSLADLESRDPRTLVFVGNFQYAPNLDAAWILVHEVLPRLWRLDPDVQLELVGPDPSKTLKSNPDGRITVTGYVEDVRPYLRRASCFVSPLRAGSGIRNKILEAMSEGTPVVATSTSCEGINVTDRQNVLLAENPAEMALIVYHLIRDPGLRARVGNGGRTLVIREHTWRSVAEQYERLYMQVASEFKSHLM